MHSSPPTDVVNRVLHDEILSFDNVIVEDVFWHQQSCMWFLTFGEYQANDSREEYEKGENLHFLQHECID